MEQSQHQALDHAARHNPQKRRRINVGVDII